MLAGKRVLVTGSSQGIGRAIAVAMLDAGASVALTSEKPADAVPGLTELMQKYAGRCHYFTADYARLGAAGSLVEAAWATLGGLDVLVNNVGTFREPSFLDLVPTDFESLF